LTILHARQSPEDRIPSTIQQSAIAIGVFALAYVAAFIATGFDAVSTLRAAFANQHEMLASYGRPYPKTILFDLTDFALGAGWLAWALALMAVMNREIDANLRGISIATILQPVIVAFTGLLQAETARVWCFMVPLLIFPAALELSRWPRAARLAIYAAALALVTLVGQNLTFMY
jgi:hypothetical protein